MTLSPARGTAYLIIIQIVSRSLTFISNQYLLRHISPWVFGLATQLELYSISALYFSRESIRIAAQQQAASLDINPPHGTSKRQSKASRGEKTGPSRQASEASQAVVNISYLAILLGCPLVYFLGRAYLRVKPDEGADTTFFDQSFTIIGISAVIELCSEPCFAVLQHQLLFRRRAAIETASAIVKGLLSCSTAVWMSSRYTSPGVLPFAIGQLGFALTVFCGYAVSAFPLSVEGGFSLLPRFLDQENAPKATYLSRIVPLPLLSRSINVYFQSVVKHFLTQGDSMILAAFASLDVQGQYAVASNYGGLVARMAFQPIEESSRNVFGKMLVKKNKNDARPEKINGAKTYLCDILHAYGIFSILACTIGPAAVPVGLRILMGSRWASLEMGDLLSAYCYYIPFLAFNGVMESFVSSAADNTELRRQTVWMGAFSGAYAAAVYFFVGVCELGAIGLIWANMMNMGLRILWSYWFIKRYFRKHRSGIAVMEMLPRGGALITGAVTYFSMMALQPSSATAKPSLEDTAKVVVTAAASGVSILYVERTYLKRLIANAREKENS